MFPFLPLYVGRIPERIEIAIFMLIAVVLLLAVGVCRKGRR
jgi:hypothetical protein